MSFRDVKIKIPDRNWNQGMWVTSRTGSVGWGFGDLRKRESWDSDLGEARRLWALQAPCVGWVESWRFKSSQHRKIVSLSSCRITFNSKVIKFRTRTNFVIVVYFGFHMSISHVRISGYVTHLCRRVRLSPYTHSNFLDRSDSHLIDNMPKAFHAFSRFMLA